MTGGKLVSFRNNGTASKNKVSTSCSISSKRRKSCSSNQRGAYTFAAFFGYDALDVFFLLHSAAQAQFREAAHHLPDHLEAGGS